MKSLIKEMQQKILDKHVSTLESLRLALFVARKLKLAAFESWINTELNGYDGFVDVPSYRNLPCQLKGWNHIRREWQPIDFEDEKKSELFSKSPIGQAVGELENLCAIGNTQKCSLKIPLSKSLEAQIIKGLYPSMPPAEVALFVDFSQVQGIVEKVKNILLKWSLDLEDAGIHGEGMEFSDRETTEAQSITYNYHAEVQTVIHNSEQPQVQQANRGSTQTFIQKGFDPKAFIKLIEEIKTEIDSLSLTVSQKSEVEADLGTLNAQAKSPNPKISILKDSLKSLKNICENITGEVAAAVLIKLTGVIDYIS